jgi:hypothetical protein
MTEKGNYKFKVRKEHSLGVQPPPESQLDELRKAIKP